MRRHRRPLRSYILTDHFFQEVARPDGKSCVPDLTTNVDELGRFKNQIQFVSAFIEITVFFFNGISGFGFFERVRYFHAYRKNGVPESLPHGCGVV